MGRHIDVELVKRPQDLVRHFVNTLECGNGITSRRPLVDACVAQFVALPLAENLSDISAVYGCSHRRIVSRELSCYQLRRRELGRSKADCRDRPLVADISHGPHCFTPQHTATPGLNGPRARASISAHIVSAAPQAPRSSITRRNAGPAIRSSRQAQRPAKAIAAGIVAASMARRCQNNI